MHRIIACLIFLFAPWLIAQTQTDANVKGYFKYFEGSWVGAESGKSGIGKGEREYQFILKVKLTRIGHFTAMTG